MGEQHQGTDSTASAPARRQLLLGAGGALVAAVLAACSSSKSSTTTSPTPSPTAASPSASASASPSGSPSGSASASASGSPSGSASASSGTLAITIKDFAFHPATMTVPAGAKITVTNQDSTTHTLTASGSGGFDTGNLAQGKSATITAPSQPGSYPFMCSIHPNMKGTLTVQ